MIDSETFQSLTFIAGYCVHQFVKSIIFLNCRFCLDFLTTDKDLLFDPEESLYKDVGIFDRGSLK